MTFSTITISAESKRAHEWLEADCKRLADDLDAYAEKVLAWGDLPADPSMALGLISQADDLSARGVRILTSTLVGDSWHSAIRNDGGIALGISAVGSRGSVAYSIMYRLHEDAKYGPATFARWADGEDLRPFNRMAVKHSSIRCFAAQLRCLAFQAAAAVACYTDGCRSSSPF